MTLNYRLLAIVMIALWPVQGFAEQMEGKLKLHAIFTSNMVLQRDKPIKIWGWAQAGEKVSVSLADQKQIAQAGSDGRWEVSYPAMPASSEPRTLVASSGEQKIELANVVVGDVWVMNGQSNMAFALKAVHHADMESIQAHMPMLRFFSIQPNEQIELATDIPVEKIPGGGWLVSSPETALEFSAIGQVFGSRLQRALQIPIGVIKNARGGASIESLVPAHKFEQHPIASRYADSVEKRMAEFDLEAVAKKQWEKQINKLRSRKVPEDKWPKKPDPSQVRSWSIPGMSPSDRASCYNGMFGVFKGFGIKGVLFHQGFNNALSGNCRPKRYRVLMKLMVEGWREDFNDPKLPVGIIGFCAGGTTQTTENYEMMIPGGASYIREAQRLGLADVGDSENTAFLPAFDIQIPGLHPRKKKQHGLRAARWALNRVYEKEVDFEQAALISAEVHDDVMVLTFDQSVMPDDYSTIPEGFALAGEDGRFYKAYARFALKPKSKNLHNIKSFDTTKIHVWSPLVKAPKGVRYAWGTSPMGNLKTKGKAWLPLYSFRTDNWDFPESDDPTESAMSGSENKLRKNKAEENLNHRKIKEAEMAVEILERIRTLGAGK